MAEKNDEPKAAAKEPTYPRERLIEEAPSLGHSRVVVVGALADLKGDGPVSVKDAKAAVEKFLKREVKEA